MQENEEREWHLDKKVSITIILALIAYAITGAIGWGVLNEKVSQIESRLAGFEIREIKIENRADDQGEDISAITADVKNLTRQVDRLYIQGENTQDMLRELIGNGFGGNSNGHQD